MIERSILFTSENAIAILEKRKTQTRRVIKPEPYTLNCIHDNKRLIWVNHQWKSCPYGDPGDRLIFRTTWAVAKDYDKVKPSKLPSTINFWSYFSGIPKPDWCGRSRPGRFLPKKLFYLMPRGEIVNIRVERVQEISGIDAIAEGIDALNESGKFTDPDYMIEQIAKRKFRELWDSINAKRGYGFDVNKYVWVIEFKML
jgi:hypothetical protein